MHCIAICFRLEQLYLLLSAFSPSPSPTKSLAASYSPIPRSLDVFCVICFSMLHLHVSSTRCSMRQAVETPAIARSSLADLTTSARHVVSAAMAEYKTE